MLLLNSCTENDDFSENSIQSNIVLVKKTTFREAGGNEFISNYFYNGTKLDRIESESGMIVYLYNGDLITSVIQYDNNNIEIANRTYLYDNLDRVITSYEVFYPNNPFWSSTYREDLIYNSDNTITIQMRMGSSLSNLYCNLGSEKLFLNEGIIIKKEKYDRYNVLTETEDYYYDLKNSPFKNITGYSKIQIPLYDRVLSTNHNQIASYLNNYYNQYDYLSQKDELNYDGTVFSTEKYYY